MFCIKDVNRDNFHNVYLFLEKINCYIQSDAMDLRRLPIGRHWDIFIFEADDAFTRYICNGCPFYAVDGQLNSNYAHLIIDANDLKGGGGCIVNPQKLTTLIILN